jgi:hypothetical protein
MEALGGSGEKLIFGGDEISGHIQELTYDFNPSTSGT